MLLAIALFGAAAAQDDGAPEHRITAGVEAFSLFLPGRQAELGYERGRLRTSLAWAELDELWLTPGGFEATNSYVELTGSAYLFQPKARPGGLHAGLNATYSYDVELRRVDDAGSVLGTGNKSQIRVGTRVGYMVYPFRAYDFFIEPTWNMGVALDDADTTLSDGSVFEARSLQITGMVLNIGGSFDLRRGRGERVDG